MGWAVLGLASSTGRQKKRSILRPRVSLSGSLGQGVLFRASAVGVAAGVQAMGVHPHSPWKSPSLGWAPLPAFRRAELSRHRPGGLREAPRSIRIAPAPLNIATALHAEATPGLSHGFGPIQFENGDFIRMSEMLRDCAAVDARTG